MFSLRSTVPVFVPSSRPFRRASRSATPNRKENRPNQTTNSVDRIASKARQLGKRRRDSIRAKYSTIDLFMLIVPARYGS